MRTNIIVATLAVVLFACALAPVATAQTNRLTFQFKNADLDTVIKALGKSLGLTFIVEASDQMAGKKINAWSDRPIASERAVAFLNSALIKHDVAAVQIGDVVKIVTLEEAKKITHKIRFGSDPDTIQIGDEIITQIIPLEVLDANAVKKELNSLTSKTGQLELNTRANVLILTDTESNVKRFLTIIRQLDTAVKEVLKLKLFRLKHASAEELAAAINEMFKPFTGAGSSSGSSRNRGRGGDMRSRMIQMWMGGGSRGNSGGGPLHSTLVRTTVEKRTNTLIVQANETTLKQIEDLITELDVPMEEVLEIRIYPLENADAATVAQVVTAIFEPEQQTSSRNNRGGGQGNRWQRWMQMMRGGQNQTTKAPTASIKVQSDERTNSVIVAASKDNHVLIRSVIEPLDRKTDRDFEVRIYQLKNADSEELKRVLDEVFEAQSGSRSGANRGGNNNRGFNFNRGGNRGGNQRGGNRGGNRGRGARGPDGPEGEKGKKGGTKTSKAGERPEDEVKVTSDGRTNTLIITATKDDFDAIDRVITRLDADNSDLESTMVIKVLNANATTLEGILNNLFQNNQAGAGRGGNQGRGNTRTSATSNTARVGSLTGNVRVDSDEDSNSLVFVTASRNFEAIRRLVAELDAERPQVLIKAFIVEVELDDSNELGVEWSLSETKGEGTSGETTENYSADFGLDDKDEPGFQYSFMRSNLSVLLRALRKDGKLSVISAPRILVQDNEDASINIGSEVPYVTNTRLTNEGTTLNTIQYRELGIILNVTPSINPQGLVKMVVAPEISEIAPESQSVQITEGVRSPVFLRNTASTTITVRDGQTIVMGGLINERDRVTEEKIPLLGDIPLLGYLFSSTKVEKKKIELLIFITPYVVNKADELKVLTKFEINNFKLIPAQEMVHRGVPKLSLDIADD